MDIKILAKKEIYWRNYIIYWRKNEYIGEFGRFIGEKSILLANWKKVFFFSSSIKFFIFSLSSPMYNLYHPSKSFSNRQDQERSD
jgi:hypothetical protein